MGIRFLICLVAALVFGELIALLKSNGVERIILVSALSTNFELTTRKAEMMMAEMRAGKTKRRRVVRYGDPKFLEAFNAVLQDLAHTTGVYYLDIYTAMKSMPDKATLLRSTDGVHLTAKGHEWVANREYSYLLQLWHE